MLYNDPTTGESADYINPESASISEETSRTMGEVAAKTLVLEAILNSLPDRSGDSSSDTSSEE